LRLSTVGCDADASYREVIFITRFILTPITSLNNEASYLQTLPGRLELRAS
jgi:hypothetical protein